MKQVAPFQSGDLAHIQTGATSCKGRVKILAFIEKPSTVKAILEHLHLPSVPLPLAKARDPPQLPLNW